MPWTDYGKQRMFAVAVTGAPRPLLHLALFVGSADPAGAPVELTTAGYARQYMTFGLDSTDHASNGVDAVFGPMAAASYLGVGVYDDDTAGGCWFFADESGSIPIADGSTVNFGAGQVTAVRTA